MAGTITYKRTIYTDRTTNKRYCYVDEKFGIRKHIKYTDDVGAIIYNTSSDINSMIKTGGIIGKFIHSKFTLKNDSIFSIPRQSVYNILKRVKEIDIIPKGKKKDIDDLYILMDEKYISNNKPNNNKIMVKSASLVEGLDTSNNRHKYINPNYFSRYSTNFGDELINHIDNIYNLENIKHIHVLADGGNWIKEVFNSSIKPSVSKATFYLDHFHFKNTLWSIIQNKPIYNKIIYYYKNNMYDDIRKVLNLYKNDNTEKRIKYLLNNKVYIKNMLNLKNMNCAAEQVISHHISSQFTSVPKAYSEKNINRYLAMRDNYKNGENLKELYLLGLQDKTASPTTIINKKPIEYSPKLEDSEKYRQGSTYRYIHYSLSYIND